VEPLIPNFPATCLFALAVWEAINQIAMEKPTSHYDELTLFQELTQEDKGESIM